MGMWADWEKSTGTNRQGWANGQTGDKKRKEVTKMKVFPCMYRKNGINLLYSMCDEMNVDYIVSDMNKRLRRGEEQYNGVSFNGIEFFYAGKPYEEDFSLYD